MKRFLISIALFSAIIIAILTAGEVLVRRIPNPYSTKMSAIDSLGNSVRTVVFGSSHTYYGIITDSLPDALNLAAVSQNFEYDYRILKRHIDALPKVKYAIIPISYFSFFNPPFEDYDWVTEIYYKVYLDIDKYGDLSYRNFEIFYFGSYSGKLSKFILHKPLPSASPTGFGLDFKESHALTPQKGKKRAEQHTSMPEGYEAWNREYFEKLIGLCTENGIKPILITTPSHKTYTDALNNDQLERMRMLIRHYRKRYGLRHYDFLTDKRFNDSDFYDQDHLNWEGAEKFTDIIKEILQEN